MSLSTVAFVAYLLLVLGGAGLLWTGRLPVLFAIAFLSTVAYSAPLLFGFALYPEYGGVFTPTPLETGVYVINSCLLATILLGGLLARTQGPGTPSVVHYKDGKFIAWFVLSLAIGLTVHAILAGGSDLFSEDKLLVLKATGRSYSLAMVCAYLAVILGTETRRWTIVVLALGVLAFDLYVGFRAWIVMAIVAAGILVMTQGRTGDGQLRFARTKILPIIAGVIVVLFFYKGIFPDIKAGRYVQALAHLGDPQFYLLSVVTGEPFIVQAILNEVMRTNYSVSGEHLFNVFLLLLVYAPELGFSIKFFNDHFQEDLFPGTSEFMGMGNSFWAEALSVGGALGVTAYLVLFISGLVVGTRLLRRGTQLVRVASASIFVPWAVYIHRNELVVQLHFERQILFILVAAIVVAMLINKRVRIPIERSGAVASPTELRR